MTENKVATAQKLLRSGHSPRDVAADLGVSLATLYRWVSTDDRVSS
jgi:transposase